MLSCYCFRPYAVLKVQTIKDTDIVKGPKVSYILYITLNAFRVMLLCMSNGNVLDIKAT